MEKLICKKYDSFMNEYTNELTEEMDKFLIHKSDGFDTYILKDGFTTSKDTIGYPIRYPGATYAGISTDKNGIIKKITLYDDMCLYREEVKDTFDKYIGRQLVFE